MRFLNDCAITKIGFGDIERDSTISLLAYAFIRFEAGLLSTTDSIYILYSSLFVPGLVLEIVKN